MESFQFTNQQVLETLRLFIKDDCMEIKKASLKGTAAPIKSCSEDALICLSS